METALPVIFVSSALTFSMPSPFLPMMNAGLAA
jgi:hypothetical protein